MGTLTTCRTAFKQKPQWSPRGSHRGISSRKGLCRECCLGQKVAWIPARPHSGHASLAGRESCLSLKVRASGPPSLAPRVSASNFLLEQNVFQTTWRLEKDGGWGCRQLLPGGSPPFPQPPPSFSPGQPPRPRSPAPRPAPPPAPQPAHPRPGSRAPQSHIPGSAVPRARGRAGSVP